MVIWKRQKHKETKKNQWLSSQGLGVGVRDYLERGTGQLFGTMAILYILIVVVATWPYMFVNIHISLYLQRVNFTVCKLCFKNPVLGKEEGREEGREGGREEGRIR